MPNINELLAYLDNARRMAGVNIGNAPADPRQALYQSAAR